MENVNRGRKILIVLIVLALLIDALTTASTVLYYKVNNRMDVGSLKLTEGAIRFVLTALILFLLYRGYKWAKWLCVVLFACGFIVGLFSLISNFNIILAAMTLFYGAFISALLGAQSVNDFLKRQRS